MCDLQNEIVGQKVNESSCRKEIDPIIFVLPKYCGALYTKNHNEQQFQVQLWRLCITDHHYEQFALISNNQRVRDKFQFCLVDIDEVIVPKKGDNWSDLMKEVVQRSLKVKNDSRASYNFRWACRIGWAEQELNVVLIWKFYLNY